MVLTVLIKSMVVHTVVWMVGGDEPPLVGLTPFGDTL